MRLKSLVRTYGADPEFFVYDAEKGEHVSPHEITQGTKVDPEPLWDGYSIQIDGLALELNTPPFTTLPGLMRSTNQFLFTVVEPLIRKRTGNNNLILSRSITTVFSERVWDTVPEENKILGCSPDFDALRRGEQNPVPVPDNPRFRTTAGHIAFGYRDYEGPHEEAVAFVLNLLQQRCDRAFLNTEDIASEQERRKLYGDVGAFRPKSFGVEWRAPSNYWCFEPHKVINRLGWGTSVYFNEYALEYKRIDREFHELLERLAA